MKSSTILAIAVILAGLYTPARADSAALPDPNSLPQHSSVCVGNKVHKPYLVGYFLTKINNAKNQSAQVLIAANTELQTRLFTEDGVAFCSAATKLLCSDPKAKACTDAVNACQSYQFDATNVAQDFFKNLNKEIKRASPAYSENVSLVGLQPFQQVNQYLKFTNISNDGADAISCNAKVDMPPALPTAQQDNSALAKFRIRGKSDDLYIDRVLPQFKSTTQASLNWTGTDKDNYSAKLQASVGYEFDVGEHGQLVPYISAYQSLTDAALKPRVIDPTNNVAFGVLGTTFVGDPADENIQHVLSAKPQYLFDTAQQSEIASLRLIYAPWTNFPGVPINANTFQQIGSGPVWASLILDFRNDAGVYTNRGNTAAFVAVNKDFDRAGGRFGITLTDDPVFPSFTLLIAEAYVYGITGYYRNVGTFQTSLTYNLDSNNYFGITASYQNGRDEDTAVAAHTYTVGLTVRY